jgi:hypothetical protein
MSLYSKVPERMFGWVPALTERWQLIRISAGGAHVPQSINQSGLPPFLGPFFSCRGRCSNSQHQLALSALA